MEALTNQVRRCYGRKIADIRQRMERMYRGAHRRRSRRGRPVPLGCGGGWRTASSWLVVVAVFLSGIWLSRHYDLSVSLDAVVPAAAASEDSYRPGYTRTEGPHLVFLFVGSSRCRWSTDPELPGAVEALKLELAAYAGERDLAFRALGVSVDWVPSKGLDHLATFGAFDEVSVGVNWANSTLLHHVWERGLGLATPAVLVYRHELQVEGDSLSGAVVHMARADEQLLLSRTGFDEILRLAELGPDEFLSGIDLGHILGDQSEGEGS